MYLWRGFHIDRYLISVNFNSKKVYEDEMSGQQDTLQFFLGESKDYKYLRKHFGVKSTLTALSTLVSAGLTMVQIVQLHQAPHIDGAPTSSS